MMNQNKLANTGIFWEGGVLSHACLLFVGVEPLSKSTRSLQLSCEQPGSTIANISFAQYGTYGCNWDGGTTRRAGNCFYNDSLVIAQTNASCAAAALQPNSTCTLPLARMIVTQKCVGQSSCIVNQGFPDFPDDPCYGIFKSLFVAAACSAGKGRVTAIQMGHPLPPPGPAPDGQPLAAQQSFIVELPLVGGGTQWLWGGDRWQTGPDNFKSHDFMAWVPLSFNSNGTDIVPLSHVHANYSEPWQLDLAVSNSTTWS